MYVESFLFVGKRDTYFDFEAYLMLTILTLKTRIYSVLF